MRLLELFSGTNSVGKEFPGEVVSLDIIGTPSSNHIVSDILEWDYTAFPPDYFEMVWASPPCVQYSRARTTAKTPRDLEGADKLVLQVLEIIAYFDPLYFFIENPWSGLLKGRAIMAHLPTPKKASYCKYGFPYQKHIAIWTNTDIKFLACKMIVILLLWILL